MTGITSLREKLAAFGRRAGRDPKLVARIVLGTLLAANVVAAYFVFRPLGGSPEELDQEAAGLRRQISASQGAVLRWKNIAGKAEKGRKQSDVFLVRYFMERREASSTVVAELSRMAKDAGIRPRDHTFSYEPIEGSDNLSLMIINGNYEGNYGDLVRYLNRLDRSERFIIVDTLQAAPQQASGQLSAQMKLYTFVREGGPPTVDVPKPVTGAEKLAAGQPQAPAMVAPGPAPPQRPPVTIPVSVPRPSPAGVPGSTGMQSPMQQLARPGGPGGFGGATGPPVPAPRPALVGLPGATGNATDQAAPDGQVRRPRFGRRSLEQ